MTLVSNDANCYFCPPSPQAIPLPPNFLAGETLAALQRATQKRIHTGSNCNSEWWHNSVSPEQQVLVGEDNHNTPAPYGDFLPDFNTASSLLQGAEGQTLTEGYDSFLMGDTASMKRKAPRPPKHIREESKRIAHVTYQMLASSAPREDIKERLGHMMEPICRDQKNIDYTMSVLWAVCREFNESLEMIFEGEHFAGVTGRPAKSSQYKPPTNYNKGDANMEFSSRLSLPIHQQNDATAMELGNVMVLLQ